MGNSSTIRAVCRTVTILFFAAGCTVDRGEPASSRFAPPTLNGATQTGDVYRIAPETRVLPDDVAKRALVDGDIITLPSDVIAEGDLAPGDVLVSAEGEGFLRKITEIKMLNGRIQLTTEQAVLTDVIEEGSFDATIDLSPTPGSAPTYFAQGVRYDSMGTWSLNTVLFDGVIRGVKGRAEIRGSLTFAPKLVFKIRIKKKTIVYVDAHVEGNIDTNLDLSATVGKNVTFSKALTLASLSLPSAKFFVGIVPVVITFDADVVAGFDALASADATIQGGIGYATHTAFGAKYDKDWQTIADAKQEFTVDVPALDGSIEGNVIAWVQLQLKVKLYGIVGPGISSGPYLKIPVKPEEIPTWKVLGGVNGEVNFDVEVLSRRLLSYHHSLFEYEATLYVPSDLSDSDTISPTTIIVSGPLGTITTASVSFGFEGSDAGAIARFECALGSGVLSLFPWAQCVSPQKYSNLLDGQYTFWVRAVDAAENTDLSPAHRTFTVNTIAPDITSPQTTIDTGLSGTISNVDVLFTFSCDEGDCTYECQFDANDWSICISPQTYSSLADGTHTFKVRAIDAVGNIDLSPGQQTFVVNTTVPDTTAPQTVIDSGPSGFVSDTGATFAFSCDESSCTYECQLDGGGWLRCSSPKSYTGLPDGSYVFEVRATDGVNNTDITPANRSWTVYSGSGAANLQLAILNHSGTADISYWAGSNDNNYAAVKSIFDSDPLARFSTTVIVDFSSLGLYDVLVLPDNAIPDADLSTVSSWINLGNKTIVGTDSAVVYAHYSGYLNPSAAGSNGEGTYWNYSSLGGLDQQVAVENIATRAYTMGEVISSSPGDSQLFSSNMATDAVILTTSVSSPAMVYAVSRDIPGTGSRIVLFGSYQPLPAGAENLIRDATAN